jgi:hypothetical protein
MLEVMNEFLSNWNLMIIFILDKVKVLILLILFNQDHVNLQIKFKLDHHQN